MSGDTRDSRPCDQVQDELAELSLGILFGRRRSEVLQHVGSCVHCSAELEKFTTVADSFLLLAPEVEPPLGFESRLAERLRPPALRPRSSQLLQAGALCAAAVILVALGLFIGARAIGPDNHPVPSAVADLTRANLTSDGRVLGEVLISRGSHAWMFMTIDDGPWSGRVKCEVTLAGGRVDTIGVFTLSGGYGAWGAPLTSPAEDVRSARLVAADGAVVANAQFSTQ
jgi:hypothetical protein